MQFSHLLLTGLLGIGVLAGACSSEPLGSDSLLLEQALCQAPEEWLVAESIDSACACVAAGATQALRSSCGRSIKPELLVRLERQMQKDCALDLGACEASVADLRRCSDAANIDLAETCSVEFPRACTAFALAPGCASFVGCPLGFTRKGESCAAIPGEATPESGASSGALSLFGRVRETVGPEARLLAR